MATPPASTEASEIRRRGRRRLVGAVAIVLLLVVFVPMILDSEPHPATGEPVLAIPPKENAPPLPAPAPPKAAEPAAAAVSHAPPPAAGEAPAPASAPPKAAGSAAAHISTAPAVKASPVRLEGFAVQVGAFRDEAKLRQVREKLVAAGVAHYTERLDTPTGELTRLRAGPFPTREAAQAALTTLRRVSLDGQVVPLP